MYLFYEIVGFFFKYIKTTKKYKSLYIKRTFVISINFKKDEIYFKNISFIAVRIKITFFLYVLYEKTR